MRPVGDWLTLVVGEVESADKLATGFLLISLSDDEYGGGADIIVMSGNT